MKKFTITENGYNVKEVNDFVDDVISQTEDILAKMKEQHYENKRLKQELERYRQLENDLKNSLITAEQSGTNIKKQAMEERQVIIDDAKKNASRIVNDALLRAEKIEIKADTLERNVRIFKRKIRLVVEQQLAVVDEIEELEL